MNLKQSRSGLLSSRFASLNFAKRSTNAREFHALCLTSCCARELRSVPTWRNPKAGRVAPTFFLRFQFPTKKPAKPHYWLRLLIATDIIPAQKLAPLLDEANQLIAILTTIVKKIKGPQ